jgi:hypothetical protein
MLATIQFHCQSDGWTEKIQNVGADTVLAEEFHSMKMSAAHLCPENLLSIGLMAPQFLAPLFQFRIGAQESHNSP